MSPPSRSDTLQASYRKLISCNFQCTPRLLHKSMVVGAWDAYGSLNNIAITRATVGLFEDLPALKKGGDHI